MKPAGDLRTVSFASARLQLRAFTAKDAPEAFALATPTLTRFMGWDPSPSLKAFSEIWRAWLPAMAAGTDLALAVRLKTTREFLGMAGLHRIDCPQPELGIWIRESAQGLGYGREAVAAIVAWGSARIRSAGFVYPVVKENRASRRLAESLGGTLVGTAVLRKPSGATLDEVVYRIPAIDTDGIRPTTE
jgi:RimJ/RimL family protein N-acetyltransferase